MAKIQLGSTPKNFKRKITFPLVSGGTGDIHVEFKFRNRTQFAEFIDEVFPDLREAKDAATDEGIDIIGNSSKAIARDVAYILGAVQGWDLDDVLDESSVKQLVNEYPAAANAITNAYREAITEGKAKN